MNDLNRPTPTRTHRVVNHFGLEETLGQEIVDQVVGVVGRLVAAGALALAEENLLPPAFRRASPWRDPTCRTGRAWVPAGSPASPRSRPWLAGRNRSGRSKSMSKRVKSRPSCVLIASWTASAEAPTRISRPRDSGTFCPGKSMASSASDNLKIRRFSEGLFSLYDGLVRLPNAMCAAVKVSRCPTNKRVNLRNTTVASRHGMALPYQTGPRFRIAVSAPTPSVFNSICALPSCTASSLRG
jgi:hypothetical protein